MRTEYMTVTYMTPIVSTPRHDWQSTVLLPLLETKLFCSVSSFGVLQAGTHNNTYTESYNQELNHRFHIILHGKHATISPGHTINSQF